MNSKKVIEVVAAIIEKDGKFLSTQRGYGEFKDGWEFPGGKVEKNESLEIALCREIKEELDTHILVDKLLTTVRYEYESFNLIMHCFLCALKDDNFTLKEHEAYKWLDRSALNTVEWLPADLLVIEKLEKYLKEKGL